VGWWRKVYAVLLCIHGATVLVFFCKIGVFGLFLAGFLQTFSRNLSARIIFVLHTTFVPTLTLLGLLNPEISFGEKKTVTQLILPSVNLSAPH